MTTRSLAARIGATAAVAALALSGCASPDAAAPASAPSTTAEATADQESAATAAPASYAIAGTTPLASYDTHFDADDLEWDAADEQEIVLADGASTSTSADARISGDTITITAGGVYRISGALTDGSLVVAAPDDEAVTLILDGASISNSTGPAIAVTSADEVIIHTPAGTESSLADGSGYEIADDSTPVAALASASDLTLSGEGRLSVTGNTNDAINSSDGLVIVSGSIDAVAVDDAIRGKDYLVVHDASISVDAGDDGLKTDNTTDAERGWMLIGGGDVTIAAGDQGINAVQGLEICGGTVTVTESSEGIESSAPTVSGGTVTITASDDGINASGYEDSADPEADDGSVLTLSGGVVVLSAGSDGLDSNGSVVISGGTVTIDAGLAGEGEVVDANAGVTWTGGSVVANGVEVSSVDELAARMGPGMGGAAPVGGMSGGPGAPAPR
ncbi:carbohydrate-binding domain-containing protein [Actinomyces sp. B33]|uniref:carbohydrate-binding domain-containing protein n=1 Tax=Actinomyces sp. B33 TaxID=2942131 RepID=UPI00233FC779|nr:carbohydrate-binding domain-containing protein [Actinomyces sp. B33]MDC4233403.1 carbohydrate-binding domain-containing protein [Actinomyces sp. B33]